MNIRRRGYPFIPSKNNTWKDFLFLAKASWKVKNLEACIQVSKENKTHLHIAGGKKFSFSRLIKSYGIVDQEKKLELLRHCDALLWPVRWHEPFGVAIIEAFSQGKPVFSSEYGSLPELIGPKTGKTFKNLKDFCEYLKNPSDIYSPDEIRCHFEENFSSTLMAKRYVQYYEKVIRGEKINERKPSWIFEKDPEDLLPF